MLVGGGSTTGTATQMGDTTGCGNCEGEGVPRDAEISVAVQPDLEIQGSNANANAAAILVTSTNTSGDDAVDDSVHRDDGDGGGGKPTTTTSSPCGMLDKACVAVFRCRFAGGVKEELLAVWKMAWPICLGYALWMQIGVVNLIFMGHVGPNEMAASSLAIMLANVTGWSVGIGLLSAVDTLASQAYGAQNYKKVGIILQRGVLVCWCYCIPIIGVWFCSEYILVFLRQDPEISAAAARFMKIISPSLFPFFLYESTKRTLQCQGIVFPAMIVCAAAVVLLVILLCFFVLYLGLGLTGSAISMTIVYFFMPSVLIPYIIIRKLHRQMWGGFSRECFKNWKEFLFLGLPGAFMTCAEWWAFEIMTILSGLLGTVSLASNVVIMNTYGIFFMIPLGMSVVSATRVGNALGANFPTRARMVSIMTLSITIFTEVIQTSLLLACHEFWAKMYTNNDEVVALVAKLLPMCALFLTSDGLQVCGGGVLRGCGRQKWGACINLASFYVFGLPLGAVLTFVADLGLWGIWIGEGVALTLSSTSFIFLVVLTKWQLIAQRVSDREKAYAVDSHPSISDKPADSTPESATTTTTTIITSGTSADPSITTSEVVEPVAISTGDEPSSRLVEMVPVNHRSTEDP
ncbi:multidrug and toxin extrusion protein 1 [Pelomyxa schiedti]|nr:multidrug and toxin extrusion protein 1 [Pelomyxa schiedti]